MCYTSLPLDKSLSRKSLSFTQLKWEHKNCTNRVKNEILSPWATLRTRSFTKIAIAGLKKNHSRFPRFMVGLQSYNWG